MLPGSDRATRELARLLPELSAGQQAADAGDTLRSAGEARARVVLDEDPDVVAGSLAIETVVDERAQALALERPDGSRVALTDGLTIGRASDNELVLLAAQPASASNVWTYGNYLYALNIVSFNSPIAAGDGATVQATVGANTAGRSA